MTRRKPGAVLFTLFMILNLVGSFTVLPSRQARAVTRQWILSTQADWQNGSLANTGTDTDANGDHLRLAFAGTAGGTWTTAVSPAPADTIIDMDFVSENEGWMLTSARSVFRWDGTRWIPYPSPPGSGALYDLSVVKSVYLDYMGVEDRPFLDVWAVGQGGKIYYYDVAQGSQGTWTSQGAGTSNDLKGVHMLGPTLGYAVGTNGTVLIWDGVAWTNISNNVANRNSKHLEAVYATAPDDGWAVGNNGTILRLTAGGWSVVEQNRWSQALNAVFSLDPGQAWAVGAGGLILRWDGSGWSEDSARPPDFTAELKDVTGISATGIWAVGLKDSQTNNAGILRYDGANWLRETAPSALDNAYAAAVVTGDRVLAGGAPVSGGGTNIIQRTEDVPYFAAGTAQYVFDAGETATWQSQSATVNAPPGTAVQIRWAASNDRWSWSGWTTDFATLQPSRYLKVEFALSTQDVTTTPRVSNFSVTYSVAGGDTTPPAAPQGLWTSPGDGQVTLAWNANGEPDLAGYNVYLSADGANYGKSNGAPVVGTGYAVTGLTNGTVYYFKVTALDTSGNESPASQPVTGTPVASGGAVALNWTLDTQVEWQGGVLSNLAAPGDYLQLAPTGGSGSWSDAPRPTGSNLYGVDVVAENDAWAVGQGGKVLHWDGANWTAVAFPNTGIDLFAVDAVSTSEVWVVGKGGAIYRWDGAGWLNYTDSRLTGSDLNGVSMLPGGIGFAVGNNGAILRWNGLGWSREAVSGDVGHLNGVHFLSASDGWAVGNNGTILRRTPTGWSKVSSPTGNHLTAIFMLSATEGYAVGWSGMVIRWDGSRWRELSQKLHGNTQRGVWAVSSSQVYAVDESGNLSQWDGSSWSRVASGDGLYGIAMAGATTGWAVGSKGRVVRYAGSGYASSGTATYVFDAGQAVTWQSHTFNAATPAGTSVVFRWAYSSDGLTWSPWQSNLAFPGDSRYLQMEVALSTSDPRQTPTLYSSSVSYLVPVGGGGGSGGSGGASGGSGGGSGGYVPPSDWSISERGPQDTKTETSSGRVRVIFTPQPDVTYTVYRHAYDNDRDGVAVASVRVGGDGRIAADSATPAGRWFDTILEGRLIFVDTDVIDYEEYYYWVVDGDFSGHPEDYTIAPAFPPTQVRHGNYTENTGACTGCHGLHSARSPEKLLKAATVIDLCLTCHDGTGSKYDEINGRVRVGTQYTAALAGPFGLVVSRDPLVTVTSAHNVGQVLVNQAPGSGAPREPVSWAKQLNCVSCHDPHNLWKNYRSLRGNLHGKQVRVRGFTRIGWSQPDRGDAVMIGEYLSGFNDFCGGCHVYFSDQRLGIVDKTPTDSSVAQNVYGRHRHPVGIPPAFYANMGTDFASYGYAYPFEDYRPLTTTLPLEGLYPYGSGDYNRNKIICLTCHQPHGTTRVGLKQVAYLNGPANNTAGAQKMDRYGGYTDRYEALNGNIGSTVNMRMDNMGVCQNCHQKNYLPPSWKP